MITSGETDASGGDIERPFRSDKYREDNTQTGDLFGDLFLNLDDDGGRADSIVSDYAEFRASSHALSAEDAGDTQNAQRTECEIETSSPTPQQASGNQDDKMAAIRKMLSDAEEDADVTTEPDLEEHVAPVTPEQSMRDGTYDDSDELDLLQSQIDDLTNAVRSAKGPSAPRGYNAAKLRRSHDTRVNKLRRAKERREKSGAFMTGFTLVSVVTATMIGLYVLHPQIIAASPRMAPVINEYVVTVDRYRFEGNEAAAEWTTWLTERIGKLRHKEA